MDRDPATNTRDRMLLAARRLIAARGVDGVAVRDILTAAEVKNGGAVHYYFGAKNDMIRELLDMGARKIDARRIRMLDECEASGKQLDLARLAAILIESSIGVSKSAKGEDSFIRFSLRVQESHPALYEEAVGNRWDIGLRRIVRHIRGALSCVRPQLVDQRVLLALELIGSTLAKREARLVDGIGDERWGRPQLLRALEQAVVGILVASEVPASRSSDAANP